jgi:CheY-like chemotaxis protein
MSQWSLEPESGSVRFSVAEEPRDATDANLAAVLIIGKSQITRIVVSKIVERSGLRPVAESLENAQRTLSALKPGTVILDGGADNRDCNHLLANIATQRGLSDRNLPCVILLSTRNGTPEGLSLGSMIDAVVAKPITPEALQPVVDRLIEAVRA